MHKRTHRALVVSNGAMMLAAYIALVTTETYTLATLFIPAAIFAMSPALVWLDARTEAYRFVTTFVTMCICFFLLGLWLVRAAALIHIITWLVMYIQLYLMGHRKNVAYYYYLFLMSFFILISACAQEPEAQFAFALGLFILSAVWAMFTLHVYAEALKNEDQSAPDIVESGGRGTMVPQGNLAVFDGNLYASLVLLSLASVFITVLLFISTPRMEAGIFGSNNTIEATTDSDSEIDLTFTENITPDPALVMRVQFPDEPDGVYTGGKKFWRSTSLELYRNARWERSALRDNRYDDKTFFYGFSGAGETVRRAPIPGARDVHQVIYLDDADIDGLPALPFVREMTTTAGTLKWDSQLDTTVLVGNLKQSSLSYEAWSDVRDVDKAALQNASISYPSVLDQWYPLLTSHDLEPRTVALVRSIAAAHDGLYDKVKAIEEYFGTQQGYQYSLSLSPDQAFRSIDEFIHVTKIGHCEIYASAMALMVRSLGIPARLVTGYAGGEWNENDGAYLVRKSMAHAWVEVYFIDYGWVTFDPSPPSVLPEPSAWGRVTRTLDRYALNAKMLWYREVVGFRGGIQWEELRNALRDSAKLDFSFLDRQTDNALSVSGFIVPLVIIWLAILGVVGWGAFSLVAFIRRRAARRRGGGMTPDQVRAQRVYIRLKRKLSKLGADCAGKTSLEIVAQAAAAPAIDSGPVHNVIDAYNRARFGGYPMTRGEYQRLTGVVRRIRRDKEPRMDTNQHE